MIKNILIVCLKVEESRDLLLKLSNWTGLDVNFNNLWHITDTVLSERAEGWSQPHWVEGVWDETLALSDWIFLNRYQGILYFRIYLPSIGQKFPVDMLK